MKLTLQSRQAVFAFVTLCVLVTMLLRFWVRNLLTGTIWTLVVWVKLWLLWLQAALWTLTRIMCVGLSSFLLIVW